LHETELSGVIVCVLDSVMIGGHDGVVDGVAVALGVTVALGVGLGQPAPAVVILTLQPPVIVPTSAPRSSTT
jgi:hypothetical protein